jgi:hypothetical protein
LAPRCTLHPGVLYDIKLRRIALRRAETISIAHIFTCTDMLCIHSSTLETQCKQGMTAPKDHLHGSQLGIRCLRTFILPLPFLSFLLPSRSKLSIGPRAIVVCLRHRSSSHICPISFSSVLWSPTTLELRNSGFLLFCPFFWLAAASFRVLHSLVGGTQQTLLGLAVFWFSACNPAQLDFTQQPTRTLAAVSPAPDGRSGNRRRERAILSLFKDCST